MSQGVNRRSFSRTSVSAATAAAAISLAPGRVLGANEQVRLGFIGVGNRGCQLLKGFLAQPDAKIVALCDVYEPYLNATYDRLDPRFAGLGGRIPKMPKLDGDVARVKDFRAILDRKDIDAVVIATPDHWHAIQMISACKAGKDVYVEKPLSATIAEGRAMVNAARKYERIVQVGTHRRSSRMYAQLAEVVQSGAIGKVTVARASFTSNMTPAGIGHCTRDGATGRARLGHVAGPSAGTTVPVDDHAVQVPLVASLFVADGELGRALFRRDPLVDRRARAGVGIGARGTICRRRRSHDPGYVRGDFRARLENADALQRSRGERPARRGPRCRDRAARDDRHALCREQSIRDRARARRCLPGSEAAAQGRGRSRQPTAISTSKPPATSLTASRAGSVPMPTSKKGTGRPRSPIWPISRWPLANGWTGTRRPSDSPIARRPTNSCTTSIASRGAWHEIHWHSRDVT